MSKAKKPLPRVTEPDENKVHYASPSGLDQVTLCGLTDWIGHTVGEDTTEPVNCYPCKNIARHFKKYRNDVG